MIYLQYTLHSYNIHTYRTKTNKVSFITKKLADRYSFYNMLNPVLHRTCYDGSCSHYSLCRVQPSGVYDGNEVHIQSISCQNMHFKIFSHLLQGIACSTLLKVYVWYYSICGLPYYFFIVFILYVPINRYNTYKLCISILRSGTYKRLVPILYFHNAA